VAIFIPGPRETLGDVSAAMDRLIVTTFDNVREGPLPTSRRRMGRGGQRLDFPDNATIGIADTNLHSEDVFLTSPDSCSRAASGSPGPRTTGSPR